MPCKAPTTTPIWHHGGAFDLSCRPSCLAKTCLAPLAAGTPLVPSSLHSYKHSSCLSSYTQGSCAEVCPYGGCLEHELQTSRDVNVTLAYCIVQIRSKHVSGLHCMTRSVPAASFTPVMTDYDVHVTRAAQQKQQHSALLRLRYHVPCHAMT